MSDHAPTDPAVLRVLQRMDLRLIAMEETLTDLKIRLDGRTTTREERERLAQLLPILYRLTNGQSFTCRDVRSLASRAPELRPFTGLMSNKQMGKLFARISGGPYIGGCRLMRDGEDAQEGSLWRITTLNSNQSRLLGDED